MITAMREKRSIARSIVVIDDDHIDRRRLRRLLQGIDDTIMIREYDSCAKARVIFREDPPDLIFIDQRLGDGLGVDFAREISSTPRLAAATLIMLTGCDCVTLADHVAQSPCHMLIGKDELDAALLSDLLLDQRKTMKRGVLPATPSLTSDGPERAY